jgi:ATP-dependent Lon protease
MDPLLPLFPLGLVLYPGEPLPLHIFEFRYREMVRLCLDEGRPFGVVKASDDAISGVGCTARIRRVLRRYDDGRMDLLCAGETRFHVREVHQHQPYLTADVEPFAEGDDQTPVPPGLRERVITQHMKLLELAGERLRPGLYDSATRVSFLVARNAGLDLDQKQTVLEMPTEAERMAYLAEHFQRLIRTVRRSKRIDKLAQGDGHAGSLPPEIR